uniref:8-amino-7-oxononanoate synthase (Kbl, GCAT) n=1 Tax=uncultured marine thaumarchaeote AD1000_49_H01 TaxID=1455922 RepID=A0A075FTL0_9ARCH|nr:8-amino-7-oxononanoate synthase (kbl, GCAT) [uncultured marine thaumarchaeote AD1000_49_H01]
MEDTYQQKSIIELCINKSKSFIYTSALPGLLINDAIKRFESNREKIEKIMEKC